MRALFVIIFISLSSCLLAQRYTYLGLGGGLISSRFHLNENLSIRSPTTITGGTYDFYLRQDLTKFLSAEIGYSWGGNDNEYLLPGESYASPNIGLWAHIVPVNLDIEVDVVENRISLHASFGYHIRVKQYTGNGALKSYNFQGDSIITEWDYIAKSKHSSLFTVGVGSRIRIIDELQVELELGYVFGYNDQWAYRFTYWDESGEAQHLSTTYKGNYWRINVGISYPIQRILELVS